MKKILLITDVDFWRGGAGHRTRIARLVRYLTGITQVTVMFNGLGPNHNADGVSNDFGICFFAGDPAPFSSEQAGERLKEILANTSFDAVIIEYIHNSYLLNYLPESMVTILDAHDIICDRAESFAIFNYAGAEYELSRKSEFEIFDCYTYVMFLTDADCRAVSKVINSDKVILAPHPPDICRHVINKEARSISFIASGYLPNKDAIEYFIQECWKSIYPAYDVYLNIYGNISYLLETPRGYNKIKLHGFAENLQDVYGNTDIVINPVRFGAGLKIKNVEALANGLPLLTTPHGAIGIEAGTDTCFLIADTPRSFSQKLSMLIENYELRCSLAENALHFAQIKFNPDSCFKGLVEIINSG